MMASDSDDFFDDPNPTTTESYKPGQSKKKANLTSENDQSTDNYTSDGDSERSRDQTRRQRNRRTRSSSSSRSTDRSVSDTSRSRSSRGKEKRCDSDSRSRSHSSGTESRSRSTSRDSVIKEGAKTSGSVKVTICKRRDSDLSTVASCSDMPEKNRKKTRPRNETRNQAWDAETKTKQSKQTHGYSKARSSADDRKSRRRYSDSYHSPAHSDSDITDVSDMSSPHNGQRESRNKQDAKPPKHNSRAPGVDADSRPRDGGQHGDKKALELNLLTKAVSELEKQNRVRSNTRRVAFEPGWPRRDRKSNYTFSDSDTYRIEQENQRLLRQIMCQMQHVDSRYTGSTGRGKKSVIPAAGINRLRDHHRIERENLAFLKKLQQIRPSKGLSRQEQLSAYSSTLLHGVPITTMHNLAPVTAHHKISKSRAGSEAGTLSRTRSVTSVQSAATASSLRSGQSGRLRSRPSSAKCSVRERPPWDDRW